MLERLDWLREAHGGPFPYEDIRHIYKTVTSRKKLTRRVMDKGFISDLDWFFFQVRGCGSWKRSALQWSSEDRQSRFNYLCKDFFDYFPIYLPVRRWITETNTPTLYRDFALCEEVRMTVMVLIRLLDKLEGR